MLSDKFKKTFLRFTVLIAMGALIFNSELVMSAVKSSLSICFSSVIPALFPFMVLSSLFSGNISDHSFGFFKKITYRLFGISSFGAAALICGMLCGYPIGARCTAELYRDEKITSSEAESLLGYSNNSGPLFVIGVIGIGMFQSLKAGILLYTIQLFSALCAGMFMKRNTFSRNARHMHRTVKSKDLAGAVCDSVSGVLNVCGFIVFFSVINVLLQPVISLMPDKAACIATSFTEITNGIITISRSNMATGSKLAFASMALGWSGMSVHMQVKSIIFSTGLSMKKYYVTRLFISAFSCIITIIITKFTDEIAMTLLSNKILIFILVMLSSVVMLTKKERKPSLRSPLIGYQSKI